MSESPVLVRDEGCVRWLVLNRPEKRNALGRELVEALRAALAEARSAGARCLALTGAGPVFSAGADLAALQSMRTATLEENLADSSALAGLLLDIAGHPLPVVAAINGHAIAGGAGLAVACDFSVAVRGALFGFTEVRIGFVPAIVLNFLLRTVGEKVARDLCLTGRRLGVEEACELGLVGSVVEAGELERAVARIAAQIEPASPEAVARTKELIAGLDSLPLEEGLRRAAEANARARATPDCQEGIAAFFEKRKPRWLQER